MPSPQRIVIEPVGRAPRAFGPAFAKVNAGLRVLQAIANLQVAGGLKLSKGERNWVLEGGAGLPAGFEEETFTICESGSPVDVTLLVKR